MRQERVHEFLEGLRTAIGPLVDADLLPMAKKIRGVDISESTHSGLTAQVVPHTLTRHDRRHRAAGEHSYNARKRHKPPQGGKGLNLLDKGTKKAKSSSVPALRSTGIVENGDVVVIRAFDNKSPFFVAQVMNFKPAGNSLTVQWFGDYKPQLLGPYRPGWISKSDNKVYYRKKATARGHRPYTCKDTSTTVLLEHIVVAGPVGDVLASDTAKLREEVIECLRSDHDIAFRLAV